MDGLYITAVHHGKKHDAGRKCSVFGWGPPRSPLEEAPTEIKDRGAVGRGFEWKAQSPGFGPWHHINGTLAHAW